jgi:hypothetical protein
MTSAVLFWQLIRLKRLSKTTWPSGRSRGRELTEVAKTANKHRYIKPYIPGVDERAVVKLGWLEGKLRKERN